MAEPTNSQMAIKAARSALVDRLIFAALLLVVFSSAVAAKRFSGAPMLAAIQGPPRAAADVPQDAHAQRNAPSTPPAPDPWSVLREYLSTDSPTIDSTPPRETVAPAADPSIRYYDGRAIRPVKRMWMTVTAYSPDARSCGKWADGKTASMKSVWTNGGCLVAADSKVLPIGSLVSVPGYAADMVVPVLDRGGAIKGPRLDVLYPTHEIAMSWGVQRLPVTVWEFVEQPG